MFNNVFLFDESSHGGVIPHLWGRNTYLPTILQFWPRNQQLMEGSEKKRTRKKYPVFEGELMKVKSWQKSSSEEECGSESSPSFLLLRSTQPHWLTPALRFSLHLPLCWVDRSHCPQPSPVFQSLSHWLLSPQSFKVKFTASSSFAPHPAPLASFLHLLSLLLQKPHFSVFFFP